jgi:hypothetical protein
VHAIALDPQDPDLDRVGRLAWRGGLAVSASDPRVGGLSGLVVDEGGQLVAVTDDGHWLTARVRLDGHGRLADLGEARLLPIRDRNGRPLTEKRHADAEALARAGEGSLFVGFERNHRVARYDAPGAKSNLLPKPQGLAEAPSNKGIESVALLPDGRLFALTEGSFAPPYLRGWVRVEGAWHPVSYRPHGRFRPSDAAVSPDGRWVYVVERAVTLLAGFMTRIVRLDAAAIRPGALLEGEEIARLPAAARFDNIEGISAVRGAGRETLLYLISDDNFRPGLLRTVILLFAVVDG